MRRSQIMTHRTPVIVLFVLLSCATCFGQSSFKGLTPGKSTRQDVERVLGQPMREFSETLSEYKLERSAEQIFIQCLPDTGVVARIEATNADAIECSSVLASLNLPSRSTAWQINSKNRLEEYFSTPFVVLTYAGADASTGVSRIAYYSRELFESSSAKLPPGSFEQNPLPNGATTNAPQQESATQPASQPSAQPAQPAAQPMTAKYDEIVGRASAALQSSDFQN